jgi:hypothetical protein
MICGTNHVDKLTVTDHTSVSMGEVLHESESLKRSVICIKKQFLCATPVKIMHLEVNDMLIVTDSETTLLHAGYLHYRSFTMRGPRSTYLHSSLGMESVFVLI